MIKARYNLCGLLLVNQQQLQTVTKRNFEVVFQCCVVLCCGYKRPVSRRYRIRYFSVRPVLFTKVEEEYVELEPHAVREKAV